MPSSADTVSLFTDNPVMHGRLAKACRRDGWSFDGEWSDYPGRTETYFYRNHRYIRLVLSRTWDPLHHAVKRHNFFLALPNAPARK